MPAPMMAIVRAWSYRVLTGVVISLFLNLYIMESMLTRRGVRRFCWIGCYAEAIQVALGTPGGQ